MGNSHVIAGAGIGLLVGILLGLSVSPVVGVVLGGLTALLATFLGLSDRFLPAKTGEAAVSPEEDERARRIREYRAGSFGLACTLGVLAGLLIRTHNLLGVSVESQYQDWLALGFPEPAARQMVVYKELGLLPEGMKEGTEHATTESASVLYAARPEQCRDLAPDQYSNLDELLRAWELQVTGQWQPLAEQIKAYVPDEHRQRIAETAWGLACEE